VGLSFTIVAGPRQRSHSQVRVSRDSWPYFTNSDLRLLQPGGPGPPGTGCPSYTPRYRLPFPSPPATRRATVEVFETASTRVILNGKFMLRPTVSGPVCLRMKHPFGAYVQILITVRQLLVCWCGVLSDNRTGLSLTIVSGPRQRSHFRVRVPWDSQPYFTVSDSRLPISSPPTTRRVTWEVFYPPLPRASDYG
jgi:hypothetical protein